MPQPRSLSGVDPTNSLLLHLPDGRHLYGGRGRRFEKEFLAELKRRVTTMIRLAASDDREDGRNLGE